MNQSIFEFLLVFMLLAGAAACQAQSAAGPVTFRPGSDLQQRVLSPSPGATATKQLRQAAIGSGKTIIDTGDSKNAFWNEPADLGGTGVVVNADMLWDASSKILYAFGRANLRCTHGKSTDGDILIGIYGKKNFLRKLPGSGWWVVNLAQNECQAPSAGLYGCKFDAQGATLACGHAELDTRINDMAITESTRF
jgi:hypothetical protein